MANYLSVTASTQKYIDATPPFDESELDIEVLRSLPDVELSTSITRPHCHVEKKSITDLLVNVTIYRPVDSQEETLPAVLYIHGGGWAIERKGSYDYICSKIAGEANCAVIFVHYSLSPEAKFPTAIEECYAVLTHIQTNHDSFKIDPTRVAVAGDSAGGNLAIAVTLLAKQRQLEQKIKFQVLFYPVTDDTFNTGSYYEFGRGYPLTRKHMQYFWNQYTAQDTDRENVLACPLKATKVELKDLPPALIIAAEVDMLRDEAENYGRKLLDAGVEATTVRVQGVLHGFVAHTALYSQETLFALDMAIGALTRAFKPIK